MLAEQSDISGVLEVDADLTERWFVVVHAARLSPGLRFRTVDFASIRHGRIGVST